MKETTRHRLAFDALLGLGPAASIRQLRAHLVAHPEILAGRRVPEERTLFTWSSRFNWQERIAEHEREARRLQRAAHIQAMREMYARQAREGLALQQEGLKGLRSADPDGLTHATAARLIVEGAKLERIAFGEPGEVTVEVDEPSLLARLERFSDEELERLARAED